MKPIIIILLLPLFSCVNTKQVATAQEPTNLQVTSDQANDVVVIEDKSNIQITITHYTPYCGGAAPTQEMLDNRNHPMSNTSYNLINLDTKEKTKVTTDALGVLHLDLGIGNYAIQELFKDCSFEEFKKQNITSSGMYQQDLGSDCYEQWWKSYLGEFNVISMDEKQHLNMSESESCFTGNNPCLMYTGPYPP